MAEETKFTRGTLHARRNNSFWDVLSEDGYVVGDTCGAGCWPHGSQEDNETTASAYAHLFAAAPDLLEALESVASQLVIQMEWIDNHDASFRDSREYMGDASLAREALAEARAALSRVSPSETETEMKETP